MRPRDMTRKETDDTAEDPDEKSEQKNKGRRCAKRKWSDGSSGGIAVAQPKPKMRRLSAKQIGNNAIIQNRPSQDFLFVLFTY